MTAITHWIIAAIGLCLIVTATGIARHAERTARLYEQNHFATGAPPSTPARDLIRDLAGGRRAAVLP